MWILKHWSIGSRANLPFSLNDFCMHGSGSSMLGSGRFVLGSGRFLFGSGRFVLGFGSSVFPASLTGGVPLSTSALRFLAVGTGHGRMGLLRRVL